MEKKAIEFMDKVYLRKKVIVDFVNDVLKNTCQVEPSRSRSFDKFLGNLIAGLTTCSLLKSEPSFKAQRFLPNKE